MRDWGPGESRLLRGRRRGGVRDGRGWIGAF